MKTYTLPATFLLAFSPLFSFAQWLPTSGPVNAGVISSLAAKNTTIFAGTFEGGVFRTTDDGATWTAGNNGLTNLGDVRAIVTEGNNIFAGVFNSMGDTAVFRSTYN